MRFVYFFILVPLLFSACKNVPTFDDSNLKDPFSGNYSLPVPTISRIGFQNTYNSTSGITDYNIFVEVSLSIEEISQLHGIRISASPYSGAYKEVKSYKPVYTQTQTRIPLYNNYSEYHLKVEAFVESRGDTVFSEPVFKSIYSNTQF